MRLLIDIGQQLAVKLAIKWPFERFELTDDRASKNVIGYRAKLHVNSQTCRDFFMASFASLYALASLH